jgi:hypothetical protein
MGRLGRPGIADPFHMRAQRQRILAPRLATPGRCTTPTHTSSPSTAGTISAMSAQLGPGYSGHALLKRNLALCFLSLYRPDCPSSGTSIAQVLCHNTQDVREIGLVLPRKRARRRQRAGRWRSPGTQLALFPRSPQWATASGEVGGAPLMRLPRGDTGSGQGPTGVLVGITVSRRPDRGCSWNMDDWKSYGCVLVSL